MFEKITIQDLDKITGGREQGALGIARPGDPNGTRPADRPPLERPPILRR
jgi:hypothetical protein